MRYTELPWPFDEWTVDDDGVIHTANGYKVRPAQSSTGETPSSRYSTPWIQVGRYP
ncbi:MAG: hypothetical protein IJI03_12215 [Rudaea sp.]|uniref:hypothetical protein n=1 Tax=Rudaea sp. 3F27F6 TaxID=2502208 RepID=UPI001BB1CA0D|nr:hypothetical protein [Rudaea sp. 3F27F6]MBR0346011.1 hypothetical protein [Rudaea sp.]